jgi:acyl-CoA dehydrogenase
MCMCAVFVHVRLQGKMFPPEYGGSKTQDCFYLLIMIDELARCGGGNVLQQMSVNSMALPPILNAGSRFLKDKIVRDVVTGKKHICLGISEPWAGSDVSAIRTTAVKTADGKAYIVNGEKKWITGGMMADYFMV